MSSVTHWIEELKAGNTDSAQPLWERYYRRLVPLARRHLKGSSRRVADEEDVLISAFDSFFDGIQRGRFPDLQDRNDLWRLLVVITARKAINQAKRHRRLKRGGGKVRGASAFIAEGNEADLARVIGDEPTPEFAAMVADELRALLDLLDEPLLRDIAVWKMEGHTNTEIASLADVSSRTVARKLGLIRKKLERYAQDE